MSSRMQLGRTAEDIAARLYADAGYEVLERNYRDGRRGEIDVIARRRGEVVFCEVKARRSERWGEPSEAVDPVKQARLRALAAAWMQERRPGRVRVRFDVVGVVVEGAATKVQHIRDAF